MSKTKHGIFMDMNAMNLDDAADMTDQEREQLQMIKDTDNKGSKDKKAM